MDAQTLTDILRRYYSRIETDDVRDIAVGEVETAGARGSVILAVVHNTAGKGNSRQFVRALRTARRALELCQYETSISMRTDRNEREVAHFWTDLGWRSPNALPPVYKSRPYFPSMADDGPRLICTAHLRLSPLKRRGRALRDTEMDAYICSRLGLPLHQLAFRARSEGHLS
jgi:hypothetical protein